MAYDLIPADVRSRLKDLRLTARRAIGTQGIGLHHSRSRGAGLEFAQYRAYEPGDELQIWIQTGASQGEMVWLKEQLEKNKIEKAQAALTAEQSLANGTVTRGSEKQIKWANDLKAKLLPQVKIVEQDMRAKLEAAALDEEKRAKNAAVLESALVEINKKLAALDQHAAKWIDFAANMNQAALARTMWRDAVKAVTSGK